MTLAQETLRQQKPIYAVEFDGVLTDVSLETFLIPAEADLLLSADLLLEGDLLLYGGGTHSWADGGGARTCSFGVDADGYVLVTIPAGSAADTWSVICTPASPWNMLSVRGIKLSLYVEDASDLTSSTLTLRLGSSTTSGYYCSWGVGTLVDGRNTIKLLREDGTEGASTDWGNINYFYLGGTMAGTAGTQVGLKNLCARFDRAHSTDRFVCDGDNSLSTATSDFSTTGGTISGGGITSTGAVAGGWTLTATDSPTAGWANTYDGSVEPPAASPAWTQMDTDTASSDGDILTIPGGGTCWYQTLSPGWALGGVADVETRLRAGAGSNHYALQVGVALSASPAKYRYVQVNTGTTYWTVYDGTTHTLTAYPVNSGEWVKVRVLATTTTYYVWFNDILVYSGTTTAEGGFNVNLLRWGKMATNSGLIQVDYVSWGTSGTQSAASLAADAQFGGYRQAVSVGMGGDSAAGLRLTSSEFPVTAGGIYTVRLQAYVSTAKTIPVLVKETSGGTTLGAASFAMTASGAPRLYSFTFTAASSQTDAYVEFDLGNLGAFTFYVTEVRVLRARSTAVVNMSRLSKIAGSGQETNPETGSTSIPALTFTLVENRAGTDLIDMLTTWELMGVQVTLKRGFPNYAYNEFVTVNIFRVSEVKQDSSGAGYAFTCPVDLDRLKTPVLKNATTAAPVVMGAGGGGDGTGLYNIIDIFMRLATSTGLGTNYDAAYDNWDTEAAGDGAGIPISRFDVDAITTERDDWLSSWTVTFTFKDKVSDFKAWADTEVFKVTGAYLYVTDGGLIGIRARRAPIAAETQTALTKNNIVETVPGWSRSAAKIVNRITFYYDYSVDDRKYASTFEVNDARTIRTVDGVAKTSQELFGVKNVDIKSMGATTADTTTAALTQRANMYFARYASGAPRVTAHIDQRRGWVAPGTLFTLTHPALPDTTAGTRGTTNKTMEVEKATPDFSNGKWALTLVETGYYRFRTFRISSLSIEYSAASAAQRLAYGWISSTSNLMSDGTDSYLIAAG